MQTVKTSDPFSDSACFIPFSCLPSLFHSLFSSLLSESPVSACYNMLTVSILPSFCLPSQSISYITFPFSQSFFFLYPHSPSSFPSFSELLRKFFLVALSFPCITLSSVSFRYFFLLHLLCIGLFSGSHSHLTYFVSLPNERFFIFTYRRTDNFLPLTVPFPSCFSLAYAIFHTAFCAGIFKQSMGARNRVGIGLSYRPASLNRLALLVS